MTGLEGNNEFGFPETVNVPRGDSEGNVKEKQTSLFPTGPVIKVTSHLRGWPSGKNSYVRWFQ